MVDSNPSVSPCFVLSTILQGVFSVKSGRDDGPILPFFPLLQCSPHQPDPLPLAFESLVASCLRYIPTHPLLLGFFLHA